MALNSLHADITGKFIEKRKKQDSRIYIDAQIHRWTKEQHKDIMNHTNKTIDMTQSRLHKTQVTLYWSVHIQPHDKPPDCTN